MVDDKAMIQNPANWPGETLCLKQRSENGYKAFGVITRPRPPVAVYLRDPSSGYMLGDFDNVKTYDTVDAMLADGWIVD